ncbi:MAG TPA: hypothetical protein VF476_04405 [Chitinophagaceae bacterium]
MKAAYCLLIILFVSHYSFAQQPDEKLKSWHEQNPIEKVYLHFDREEYLAGQTAWLKAYLYSDFLPSDLSTVLFVELLNSSSKVLQRQTLPVLMAVSQGQIELPDTLAGGQYIIRAYTATMLNHDENFVFKRTIRVAGKNKNKSLATETAKQIRLEFFAEGGNFVTGLPNTIAFKATDENGWPVNVNAVLKNSNQQIMAEFSSLHDGMGMFDVDAEAGTSYFVELKDDPSHQKYPLPQHAAKGVVFRLLNAPDGIHFEIFQEKNDPLFQVAYMIGQMQHYPVFKQTLKQGVNSLSGVINASNLSSGILHITLFNKDGMPLAERLSFVNNKEYIKPADLTIDTVNFSPRSKNHFSLAFKDSVSGSFSVSITDPAYNPSAIREQNIFSSLLLTADLKGYVHNPAYYFSADNDSVKTALDLLMMTHGWTRFKWEQLIKDPLPALKYKDPAFVTLSGRVMLDGTKKPFADKELLLYLVAADSSRNMQLIKTDATGDYRMDSVLFFGRANILFSDIRGKKSKFVDVRPSPDSLHRPYVLRPLDKTDPQLNNKPGESNKAIAKKMADEYDAFLKGNGLVLSEVIVKAKKKSAIEELEDKYASGAFSGDSRKTFDLVNSDEAASYMNIFEFLQARVPGLVAGRDENGDYYVYFRQQATISSMGNQGMDIFLDEVLTDANMVGFISPNQIAMVKVFSNFVGSTGGGAGGALAIYLKKGTDYFNSLPSAAEMITYNGFSVIKEFYSPDYKVVKKNEPDQRMTIYWKPDIFVHGKNSNIPISFYNNDRSRQFKVVIEGITADGKMLMIEKLIGERGF